VPIFWADPGSGISFNVQVQIPEERTQTIEDLGNVPVTSSAGKAVLLRNIATIAPGTPGRLRALQHRPPRQHHREHPRLRSRHRDARHPQAVAAAGPAPDARTKVDVPRPGDSPRTSCSTASAAASSSPSS
jgi:hypothetical protein